MYRTHICGEVNEDDVGHNIIVSGWVNVLRNLGKLIFIDIRDESGITQVVINKETAPDAFAIAVGEKVRSECVVQVEGIVQPRVPKKDEILAIGAVEIDVHALQILNAAKVLPFLINADGPAGEKAVDEDLRLQFRYLDLRRPRMQRNLHLRAQVKKVMRNFLERHGFTEVEQDL